MSVIRKEMFGMLVTPTPQHRDPEAIGSGTLNPKSLGAIKSSSQWPEKQLQRGTMRDSSIHAGSMGFGFRAQVFQG